jgi:hypothetical protein
VLQLHNGDNDHGYHLLYYVQCSRMLPRVNDNDCALWALHLVIRFIHSEFISIPQHSLSGVCVCVCVCRMYTASRNQVDD